MSRLWLLSWQSRGNPIRQSVIYWRLDIRYRLQCGFKLFRRDVALDLFTRQLMDGFSFDLELLYLASKLGYKTIEVPVEWIDAPGSKVDATKVSLSFMVDLCKIRYNDLRGRYAREAHPHAISTSTLQPTS